jgi:hypothetical protein
MKRLLDIMDKDADAVTWSDVRYIWRVGATACLLVCAIALAVERAAWGL